jgi:DNA-entry nuclease
VGNNLVCTGVQIEAYSIEDAGEGICFNVFCYNVQPGVTIRYETGHSFLSDNPPAEDESSAVEESADVLYILNTSSKKIHKPGCGNAKTISEANRKETHETLEALLEQGYTTCGTCFKD